MNSFQYSVDVVGDPNSPSGFGGFWPTQESRITSPFGERIHPVTGKKKMHNGVDIGTFRRSGVPVFAPRAGVVRYSSSSAGGTQLTIDTPDFSYSLCHLSERLVPDGAHVRMGQLVALSGNTGASSGPHLHFGVWRKSGASSTPVDPMSMWWLRIDGFGGLGDEGQGVKSSPDGGLAISRKAVASSSSSAPKPRGYRNNNPLNVRKSSANNWEGAVRPGTDPVFEQFSTMAYGYRCALYLIRKYIRQGYNTIAKIVSRWAPPTENDTNSYIAAVSSATGIEPDRPVHDSDAVSIKAVVAAMARQENGEAPRSMSDIDEGWRMLPA